MLKRRYFYTFVKIFTILQSFGNISGVRPYLGAHWSGALSQPGGYITENPLSLSKSFSFKCFTLLKTLKIE